ncbi:MAG: MMPL family transporter [Acidobacteria bacterium]|nr:MMPL family transporter [Acidobacteriota bacterium]
MRRVLRVLLRLHLRRSRGLWILLAGLTTFLTLGVFRVERRLDLISLLPTAHPVVRASLEAGVGQQELLWLVAEGNESDMEGREAWAEALVGRLMDGVPLNGMSAEGRFASPHAQPGPGGAALWPPLLAAGSLVDGDGVVERMVTEQLYALSPLFLGDDLAPLVDGAALRRRFRATARALASPEPFQARLAKLDPLRLSELLQPGEPAFARALAAGRDFPLHLRTGYLSTKDHRFVLLPLVLQYPSGDGAATARLLAWLGKGGRGVLPAKATLEEVGGALAPRPDRSFPLQVTGAHAIAYWESQRLGREVLLSFGLSFLLIGVVYWVGFRTLAGYGFVVLPLLLGILWSLGLVGWILGRLNLMAAAFGAVLLGVGDDVGILLFTRYREARRAARSKPQALRAALLGTGPGAVAGALATAAAFLACAAAPFPGFRDLGLTAGLGLLACLAATFLLLPALLLSLDRGKGVFAPGPSAPPPRRTVANWKVWACLGAILLLGAAASRLRWEEDLRRFRQAGNPALTLQESLGRQLGAGLQPLALEFSLDHAQPLPQRWNRLSDLLRGEGLPWPAWRGMEPELRLRFASQTWLKMALESAEAEGLDPAALERPLAALQASAEDPMAGIRALAETLGGRTPMEERRRSGPGLKDPPSPAEGPASRLLVPLRLSEAAQDRVGPGLESIGARLVGTRPLMQAVKEVARGALKESVAWALGGVLLVIALFGRRARFVALALLPLGAGVVGCLGSLGLSGEPLTFLSLVALPVTLGVSVDVAMNLLHRARQEPGAAGAVARVNAVCAGTTLAGFGGLVFSAYRGLRGLGIACIGGVALALLLTQWLLPWVLERWPLSDPGHD